MILNCPYCNQSFDSPGLHGPGDVLPCPFCKMEIRLQGAATVKMDTDAQRMALSPPSGEFRPMAIADEEVLPAGALLGQYRVEEFIGRGGMGAVYRARHSMLQRDVAVKVLPPKFAKDSEFVSRFKREALALANLSHPNIVAIHDMGTQGEIYYFVMEYVDGINLRDVLSAKKLTPEQALKIVPQLCDALEYAHSKGIVHRDIKPENIILDKQGTPKVADFGLAKIVKGETATVPLTQTNVVMGTVEYMAPEQRDSLKAVDHRADIYSMGVVLYEMLTGDLPVGKFDPPSHKVAIDVRIDDVVLKALEREPDRRYQRASHMGTDVTQVHQAAPVAREWPVVDQRSRKALGTVTGRKLAVQAGSAELDVNGWDKPEIGIESDDPAELLGEGGSPVLRAGGDERLAVFVPRGIELAVTARESEVHVTAFSGSLALEAADNDVSMAGVEGHLDVRMNDGSLAIDGLKSENAEIRTRDGSVAIDRFEFVSGRAAIETADGEVDVLATTESNFRYQAYAHEGSIAAPPGGTASEHSASGAVGEGRGTMSLRTRNGSILLRTGEPPKLDLASLKGMFSNLTRKQAESLGTFVIVNVILWIFFLLIGSVFPAACITCFWGMAIALDLWKSYVRAPQARDKKASKIAVVVKAEKGTVEVGPAEAVPVAPAPPEVKARLSLWTILCFFAAIPTVLAVTGLGIVGLIGMSGADEWGTWGGEYWMWLAGLSFASLVCGTVSVALGLAVSGHLREAQGALSGRGMATFTTVLGGVAMLLPMAWAKPAVEEASEAAPQVRAVGEAFIEAARSGDVSVVSPVVADGELTPELRAKLDEAFRLFSDSWKKDLEEEWEGSGSRIWISRVGVGPSMEQAQVSVYAQLERKDGSRMGYVTMHVRKTAAGWRIVELDNAVRQLTRSGR